MTASGFLKTTTRFFRLSAVLAMFANLLVNIPLGIMNSLITVRGESSHASQQQRGRKNHSGSCTK